MCSQFSTVLNPFIVYFLDKKEKTVKNFLFELVAVSDFLTNLLPGIFICYVFFSSEKFDQFTVVNQLPEFLCCTFGCISQVTVTRMAVTRMVKIIRPFWEIKFKWVLTYLIVYIVYMVLGNAGALVFVGMKGSQKVGESLELIILERWNKRGCFAVNMFHCFLGIVCSLVTVGYLRINMRGIGEKGSKLRGSNTILLMNIPYVISIVTNFLALRQDIKINFSLVNHYMVPIFISAFNPCVIIARTKTLRSRITGSNYRSRTVNSPQRWSQMVLLQDCKHGP